MDYKSELKNYLDENGRLKHFPSKHRFKMLALLYLASHFESGRTYTEKEVNAILTEWHSFNDFYLLRREMIGIHLLGRERDCSAYWLENPAPTPESLGIGE